MNVDRRYKNQERVVATLLEGKRIPNNGFGQPDVVAGPLDVQVKTRKTLPDWFTDASKQAVRDAGEGQLGVVVFCQVVPGHTKRYLVADLDAVLAYEPPHWAANYSDEDLDAQYEEAMQWRDWQTCDLIAEEAERRNRTVAIPADADAWRAEHEMPE